MGSREAQQLTHVTIPSNDSRSPVHGEFRPGYEGGDVNVSLNRVPVPLAERIMSVIAEAVP
jgi:hypothetical protein